MASTLPLRHTKGFPSVATAHPPQSRRCASAPPSFALHRRAGALVLELQERSVDGCSVAIVTAFTDLSAFNDWCDDDPLRFEYPVVHQQVRRQGHALWGGSA